MGIDGILNNFILIILFSHDEGDRNC